ncbi:putative receptor like protein 25 isoform X1 [Punica granatum]|uniref:Receptor like protein 25 isoform X1 n=1 Tax=Punica granatum TaxID=22663 RepID=A0A218W6K6_PUNGR|nr:putative receptor like protein 25 isoform X1 [Punica granatum]OWM67930.1 hypothetical protein CDL15_Pgr010868 [Punica granatum]
MCGIIAAFCLSFLLTPSLTALDASPPTLPSRHSGHADECTALLQFKNSLKINEEIVTRDMCAESSFNYTSSLKTASWKEGTDCCSWDEITCDDTTSNVIKINLTCSYLQGTLHSNSSLFSLHHLQRLYLTVLHIFDISNNSFIGTFPSQYIANFNDMMGGDKQGLLKYGTRRWSKFHSTTVIYKGVQTQLSRIREALVIIDLSHNHFQGEIPKVIGSLQSLIGLNLSHNNFRGLIPTSLGNLTHLEWLDLSSNNFTGEIPATLTNLTSLAIFNVSTNQLTGQIPQGKQFGTFSSDSFEGNPNLCGPPLPKPCTESPHQEVPPASQDEDDADHWIEWRAVLMGYGCGTVIGLSIGYIFIQIRRPPAWLIKMVVKKQIRTENKPRKSSLGTHGRNHRAL